jgi:RNA polymerase sigma factor (sigma-70 family)
VGDAGWRPLGRGIRGMRTEDATDDDCLRALAADSSEAFGVLFERYSDAVHNCAFRRTASWSAAEDITETVFLELWRQRHRVTGSGGSVRPWLLGVASNQARRWWRSHARRDRAVERLGRRETAGAGTAGDELADLVAARLDDERRMAGLLDALDRLPGPQQEALMLWAWEGLSYEEIAVALDVRIGTVRSRLNRARTALKGIEAGVPGTPGIAAAEGRED